MSEYFSYADPIPDDWLDPANTHLLTQVRAALAQRAAAGTNDAPPHFLIFAGMTAYDLPAAVALPAALQTISAHLEQALTLMQQQDVAPMLAPSAATRLPGLGWLWQRVRHQAHQLVLFYVNRQAAQSVQINQQLLAALTDLLQVVAAQQEALARLQAEQERAELGEKAAPLE